MSRRRIIVEAVVISIVFFAGLALWYWILTALFGIPTAGAIMLLLPAFLLGGLACIYGFYYSYSLRQDQLDGGHEARWSVFERAFRLNVFAFLMALPAVLSLYFGVIYQDIPLMLLFGIMAAGVGLWVLPKIIREAFPRRH